MLEQLRVILYELKGINLNYNQLGNRNTVPMRIINKTLALMNKETPLIH
jgi:hypothetical protein